MEMKRQQTLRQLRGQTFDALILGGGINGAVTAASLSARGLKVALIDKGDFASGCSSNSSHLIWGGINYLESHQYLLVNKLCKSRNQLMRYYPSTVKEIRFLTSLQKGFRLPLRWVFLGGLLYWAIGRFVTQSPELLDVDGIAEREPLIDTGNLEGGLEYSDAYLEGGDARFVFSFISKAVAQGACVLNYVESLGASRNHDGWISQVQDKLTGEQFSLSSQLLINACGPMVDQHNSLTQQQTRHHHLFSK
ncbi:MAG: FAD-dependent oxidoreductase, partial [Cellvibrionaceae bacterium]|nr:FAD-dependent oxidoreductase [Cellvibrionaceae bacterium]